MEVEISELSLCYAGLRIIDAGRQARLEASIARDGQQSPVLVVASSNDGFVLVDGYQRMNALKSLGRDVIEVVVLGFDEGQALVELWRLEAGRRRSALEDGWLLLELVERHGRSQGDLGRALRRSKSWVSGRLAMVRALPETIQDAVRRGEIPSQAAMKHLVPLSRANPQHAVRLVAGLGGASVSVRQLGRLYATWRAGDDELRERLVTHPLLFLKVEEAFEDDIEEDDGQKFAGSLEALCGLCGKLRRNLRERVFSRANTASQATVRRRWKEAQLAFEGLSEHMNNEVTRVGSADKNGNSATA